MTRNLILLTHAQVRIDPEVPITDWPLSDQGAARHRAFDSHPALDNVTAIYSSEEQKARDGAAIHSATRNLTPAALHVLCENDRTATGYLPPAEFETAADAFFAQPDQSVRGWETARAAHARFIAALRTLAQLDRTLGDILVVAHGAVAALLRCHLFGIDITRTEDQPAGGGCWFTTDLDPTRPPLTWSLI